ncbi:hypothetical protein [Clostridium uliginosum]|uniref:Uncharacterized protein n=1 Tax=Clostridium uliginosum TaxID=119641 RepID=A0A1I1HP14_9CLOT|nr:hypothetical protein [Clostridium uliginosum]SFC22760.1 hypothetical protein SAMN05421842_101293 [Clostridium uliginosum]
MNSSVIFKPSDFINKRVVNKNIVIERDNKSLIIGSIKDDSNSKIENAVIMVYEEYYYGLKHIKREIGFTTTNHKGEFFILLHVKKYNNYIFEIYHPLTCGNCSI